MDRLGVTGVSALLGPGRAMIRRTSLKVRDDQAQRVLAFVAPDARDEETHLNQIATLIAESKIGAEGLNELEQIVKLLSASGLLS